ncbi:hypothetical protein OHA72_39075 [Dactylosporangium sp. NBC_01737]|uniref:hypothetical protein n=1 Tax=Dactylosporangium sp. NBC_01737 TaxID=2975959 RepID=UPI002E16252E|nr:hypothetical protein OHA72_39075 [Dactylosporangium sp. NBC_01737]
MDTSLWHAPALGLPWPPFAFGPRSGGHQSPNPVVQMEPGTFAALVSTKRCDDGDLRGRRGGGQGQHDDGREREHGGGQAQLGPCVNEHGGVLHDAERSERLRY